MKTATLESVLRGFEALLSIIEDGRSPTPEVYAEYYEKASGRCETVALAVIESFQAFGKLLEEVIEGECRLSQKLAELVGKRGLTFAVELFKDCLTGVWNRRALSYYFAKVVLPTLSERTWSLAFIDLNNFKKINDTYGHLEGDRVLREFAQLLSGAFSGKGELVCRYGGDEFVVVSPCSPKEMGRKLEELLAFSDFAVGVTAVSPGDSLSSVIDRADRAMYRSKKTRKVEYA
ncbi:GGDEF domain-containing protein [Thermovibrio ammonificans]|nr:GGDEF domain-containing protein [Thermovibrio ammonificans]